LSRFVEIYGAREHNLKGFDLKIPRDSLVVITGLSGSGKSSLAFDTLFVEGQRRYVESLSPYIRQFLGLKGRPEVDRIEGLSPTISIEQKGATHNPRSTVGTVTEIYDYLRLLFARVGEPHCPECGEPVQRMSLDEMVEKVLRDFEGKRVEVYAPVVRGKKGEHRNVLIDAQRRGFTRARVDGTLYFLEEEIELDRNVRHDVEILVDRLRAVPEESSRLSEALEAALELTGGLALVVCEGREEVLSELYSCPSCGASLPELEPRLFSFNSPQGACPACSGIGYRSYFSEELAVRPDLSLREGALIPWSKGLFEHKHRELLQLAREAGVDPDVPFAELPGEVREVLLEGGYLRGPRGGYVYVEGLMRWLNRKFEEAESDADKAMLERFRVEVACSLCGGSRLRREALAVKVGGRDIYELTCMSASELLGFIGSLSLTESQRRIVDQVLKEISSRLSFMVEVGVGYLSLSRRTSTLSGGEFQRVRLATQIGSRLTGVMYVLDEPTVGLHPRDTGRLLRLLEELRDLGNTVVVVEHDRDTMLRADYLVELGPGAGERGGDLVFAGSREELLYLRDGSLTAPFVRGEAKLPLPASRRRPSGWVRVRGARRHNLKGIDVDLPLGVLVCITGVSGSGKSTLMYEVLYKGLRSKVDPHFVPDVVAFDSIEGFEGVDKVVLIDQSPIGRTPRSNPATYTEVFGPIRDIFASLPESRVRGYRPGRFSFNVRGGRCEACGGEGVVRVSMQFLPDVYVPCDVCKGRRYNRETLEVKFKGKSIADVLDMTVDEALELFENVPPVRRKLQVLQEAGLGYIRLGQPATTLSGGEAQRVKLAYELAKRFKGHVVYMLDEPTVGLHYLDVRRLLEILHRLVDQGNTVVVIEHNLDVMASADHIIDLGPEGGEGGGEVVDAGTPEEVASRKLGPTGVHLSRYLEEMVLHGYSQPLAAT